MRLILVSHAELAKAILETAEMFVGDVKNVGTLGLKPGDSPDDFEDDLRALVNERESGEETLILCDLLAGTPFNVASKVSYGDESVSVIYGMNLGMLLEALDNRDEMPLGKLTAEIISRMPSTYGIGQF